MDFFVLHALARELNQMILHWRISNIGQIKDRCLAFSLRPPAPGVEEQTLIFDAGSSSTAGVFLEPVRMESDSQTLLARSFKNKLSGARITGVETPVPDRFLVIHLELAEWSGKREIWFELRGATGNVCCVDDSDQIILECLTKIPEGKGLNPARIPGKPFRLYHPGTDPSQRFDLGSLTWERMMRIIGAETPPDWRRLMDTIQPMTPTLAKQLTRCLQADDEPEFSRILGIANRAWTESHVQPAVILNPPRPELHAFLIHQPVPVHQSFSRILDAARDWRHRSIIRDPLEEHRIRLLQLVTSARKRVQRSIQSAQHDLANLDDPQSIRQQADLLAANFHKLQPELAEIEVVNYFDPSQNTIRIALQPGLPAPRQLERLFRKAGKIERARPQIEQRLQMMEAESTELDHLHQKLRESTSEEELTAIEDLLVHAGIIQLDTRKGWSGAGMLTRLPYLRFRSSDGWIILVGRGAVENDVLTFREASPHDFWLHAHQYRGAHVVIRNPMKRRDVPDNTQREAGALAVYYSKARGEKAVSVIFARRNQVRRAPGKIPGRAVVSKHQTLQCDSPDESFIQHHLMISGPANSQEQD